MFFRSVTQKLARQRQGASFPNGPLRRVVNSRSSSTNTHSSSSTNNSSSDRPSSFFELFREHQKKSILGLTTSGVLFLSHLSADIAVKEDSKEQQRRLAFANLSTHMQTMDKLLREPLYQGKGGHDTIDKSAFDFVLLWFNNPLWLPPSKDEDFFVAPTMAGILTDLYLPLSSSNKKTDTDLFAKLSQFVFDLPRALKDKEKLMDITSTFSLQESDDNSKLQRFIL